MSAKTLLMALGVGVVVGLILGVLFVGLISGNREQAAPTPPPRTVQLRRPSRPLLRHRSGSGDPGYYDPGYGYPHRYGYRHGYGLSLINERNLGGPFPSLFTKSAWRDCLINQDSPQFGLPRVGKKV